VTHWFQKRWRWYWHKRYYFAVITLILFALWWRCLPQELFKAPTSTVLTDVNGEILGARIADDGQWRFPERTIVPEKFAKAIIQFEDRTFYNHIGFSVKGFARAIQQNLKAGKVISGGSTISMQTIRISRQGKSRSLLEKFVEVAIATRMELSYSKDQILAFYASYAPMGGNVVGIDAAAWRYFGRRAEQLSWSEACVLAILPNAPSLIRPGKNRSALIAKRNRLLDRLHSVGEIDALELKLAKAEPIPEAPSNLPDIAPHLMDHFIKTGKKGEWITSSISFNIQQEVNRIVAHHHQHLSQNQIQNAAVLVLDVRNNSVVAYTGNTSGNSPDNGNSVDVITAPRSTGSILKPFLYGCMINDGNLMPHQLVEDIPMIISGYSPKNYNGKYDGAVPASKALSRSLNVPIVKLLKSYGVQKFHRKLRNLGLTTINRPSNHYGLSLILGGAEASLWDLCVAYGQMASTLNHYDTGTNPTFNPSLINTSKSIVKTNDPIISASAVWETFQAMLEVTRPDESQNWQVFNTSEKIAWKTGTSYGFRDAWAIGINSNYVVGVWVGNADGEGRPGLVGIKAAAPILFDVFDYLPDSPWFNKPLNEMSPIAVCRQSGYRASIYSPDIDTIMAPKSCLKTTACPYSKLVHLDHTETHRVNSSCYEVNQIKSKSWFVLPPIVEQYYKTKNPSYKSLPSYKDICANSTNMLPLAIIYPKTKSTIYVPIQLDGSQSKTIFEASHKDENATLFWHLDHQYLGKTKRIHQLQLAPESGTHTLTVIDDKGAYVSRIFQVSTK